MRRWLAALGVLLSGCLFTAPCKPGPTDSCARSGMTCDLDKGECVERPPCAPGVACPAFGVCYVNLGNKEGQVSNDPNGCLLNCMGVNAQTLCAWGYRCDEATGRCGLLATACRPGTVECGGGNCTPEGRCAPPSSCLDDLECADGFLCERKTHTCYLSCLVDTQCAPSRACDPVTHRCTR